MRNKNDFYCVCAFAYECSGNSKYYYGKQKLVGLLDDHSRVYVFDDDITDRTIRFHTKKECCEYIRKCRLWGSQSVERLIPLHIHSNE